MCAPVNPADAKATMEAVLANTGQPPAEKLKQISNLRYDRLLSDAGCTRRRNASSESVHTSRNDLAVPFGSDLPGQADMIGSWNGCRPAA